ncbi:MAG: serine/threonine-protein kinase [Acidobacteriota bacterium]
MSVVLILDVKSYHRLCQAIGLLEAAEVTHRVDRALSFLEETRLEKPLILRTKLAANSEDLLQRMRWLMPAARICILSDNPDLHLHAGGPQTAVFTEPLAPPAESAWLTFLRGEGVVDLGVVESSSRYFGRYAARELIGEGGEGKIFHGWDPLLRRPVAIKQGLSTDLGSLRRSKWEGRKAASVDHPHVVQVFDCVNLSDGYALILEYLPGGDLASRLQGTGRLPYSEFLHLGDALTRALVAIHGAGLVHGDIKPANVMIGEDDRFKLGDFGTAGNRSQDLQLFRGTPGYLPPEVCSGGQYTAKSDVYALGVLLYRTLTGDFPFRCGSIVELLEATLVTPVPSCRWACEHEEVEALVSAMMQKEPGRRPDLDEAVAVFQRVLKPAGPQQRSGAAASSTRPQDPPLDGPLSLIAAR